MTVTALATDGQESALKDPEQLIATCREALDAAQAFSQAAKRSVSSLVAPTGRVEAALVDREQFAAHGYAWLATYVSALKAMLAWAEAAWQAAAFGELEQLILRASYGEYLQQMTGGIALSQVEVLRPADMGIEEDDLELLNTPAVRRLARARQHGRRAAAHRRIDFQ